jgi:hypothetical protein
MQIEEARRELTELLLDAKCNEEAPSADGLARYRARSGTSGLDISAMVAREGRLLIVVSASVRHYR